MDEIDGDPDLEANGDEEPSGDEHELSHNPPVTEGVLGQPKWEPGPMPITPPVELPMLVLPEAPEGYVAIRELR